MIIRIQTSVIAIALSLALSACNQTTAQRTEKAEPDILHISPDGLMVFNDRVLPAEDVIIYPDGFGGEKAAVKLYAPYHPPFYRDSIIVRRLEK
jgi:hypothetical protein